MKRADKEISDRKLIKEIINEASILRIAFCDGGIPYIVPLNFGFKDDAIYIHSAREGKKIDLIRKNNNVCFELDIKTELVKGETPCRSTMRYMSVIGFGKACFLERRAEKRKTLKVIVEKYLKSSSFEYDDPALDKMAIIKIDIERISGKKSGY
jgi:nitroimidazol reductase NimA-like FMN-containing flavoprotein (pyridoxamine 5'-phosphate oxidase superfamily)